MELCAVRALRTALWHSGLDVPEATPFYLVGCTILHMPENLRTCHTGMLPATQLYYARNRKLHEVLAQLPSLQQRSPRVVAFWCNAGEHRSVACAELYAGSLAQQGVPHELVHLCGECWDQRGCGGCRECRAWAPERDEAQRLFDAALFS